MSCIIRSNPLEPLTASKRECHFAEWIPVFRAESYEEQDGLIANLFANFLPAFFENCEALLRARGGSHFGGGDELTYGDICVFQGGIFRVFCSSFFNMN